MQESDMKICGKPLEKILQEPFGNNILNGIGETSYVKEKVHHSSYTV